jgi:predicted nucleic acid-binding protein
MEAEQVEEERRRELREDLVRRLHTGEGLDVAAAYEVLTAAAADAAVQAQEELAVAPRVSHRIKPVDLLIAAVAASEGLGVLHYDGDYDTISEHTSLRFASVWVAPRGSID